jgi:signal peptidase I
MASDEEYSAAFLDESEVRSSAAKWIWWCPGIGFAKIGRPGLAWLTFLLFNTAFTLLLGGYFLTLSPAFAWAFLVAIALGLLVWVIELVSVRRASLREPSPTFFAHSPLLPAAVTWGTSLAAGFMIYLNVGSVVMAGGGMAPTINNQERLVYLKRVEDADLRRGAVIAFRASVRSAWSPGALVIARIAAEPGDHITLVGDRYVVNGTPGPTVGDIRRYKPVLEITPGGLVVPAGCYFMCQEARTSYDSSVLWWAERANITSRIWYLRSGQFFDRVE